MHYYDIAVHYDHKHWHLSCLLDHLVAKADNPRLF